jgi:hypothetical protein
MSEPDILKIDPIVREYLQELREAARRAKGDLKAVELERDALIARLEELQKEKLPESEAKDFRTLSPEEYRRALREMRHKAVLDGYDERQAPRTTDATDTRKMSPEEYRDWKLKVSGRKAW